jgi:hypothetical protein
VGNIEALLRSEASGPTDRIMELDAGAGAWALATNAPSSFVVSEGLGFRRWRVVLVDFPCYKFREHTHVSDRPEEIQSTHSFCLLLGVIRQT